LEARRLKAFEEKSRPHIRSTKVTKEEAEDIGSRMYNEACRARELQRLEQEEVLSLYILTLTLTLIGVSTSSALEGSSSQP